MTNNVNSANENGPTITTTTVPIIITTCGHLGVHLVPRVLPVICENAVSKILIGSLGGGTVGALICLAIPPASSAAQKGIQRLLKR